MIQRLFLHLSVFLVSLMKSNAARPHIIFILADDMGWNDVSFHGSDQIPTPNIDALAYNGVILNNLYAMPTCTPSRAALMTGKHPIHTGMQGSPIFAAEPTGLPLNEKLLPQYLKDLGYTTRMIGKWHLGYYRQPYIPLNRGFDSHFGYYNGLMGYYNHIIQDSYPGLGEFSGRDLRDNRTIRADLSGRYATDLFTEEAERLISEHSPDQPLFLYMAHLAVHAGNKGAALEAPQETIAKFQHITEPNRQIYAAMVSKLDESVGRVVAALGRKRMLENSIIVFMSDNGAPSPDIRGEGADYVNWGSNYPFRGVKNTLWNGGVRSASFIWSPRLQQSPRVCNQLMHITDWLPTLISAAEGDPTQLPKDLDGIDQWVSLLYGIPSSRKYLLINIDERRRFAAIVKDSWKLTIGTFLNGTKDGFYGDQSKYPGPAYRPAVVRESLAHQALSAMSQTYSLSLSDEERMLSMRQEATVRCPGARSDRTPCPEGPCLFNLETDPCETNNLAVSYINIASHLFEVLKYYKLGLVSQINRPPDPLNANPAKFNNTWQSWVL
nr:PREDICTED: arylsulfatase B-like [Bemisia tabaci]